MKNNYKIDEIDLKILEILKDNARIQWREIGEAIHLTGQAVGERVRRMVAKDIITGFYAEINESMLYNTRTDYITAIMTTTEHQKFIEVLQATDQVKELYKISGNGCYMLKVVSQSDEELNQVLDKVLKFANYQLNSVIKKHK